VAPPPETVVVAARTALRGSARDALVAAGFTVAAECRDVRETLAAVERLHPDVCVVDRDLPGGGLAAIAALATPGRRPRVIVVGGETPAEVRAARLAGAADCLPASVDADVLAASVAAATRHTRGDGER